jgi:anti-sigma-K factor RskA
MTDTRHDEFAASAAAYALDALDIGERRQFEAHLETCAECRADVTEYRRVTAGLGVSIDPVAPPESLKARTLARAMAPSAAGALPPGVHLRDRRSYVSAGWLAAAAGVMIAAAAGIYAWSLRAQLDALRTMEALASSQVTTLRTELAAVRGDSQRLARTVGVLTAPDVVRVDLAGTAGASAASGRAFFSPSRGLLFNADGLPALQAGRIYQLWMVLPNRAPVSAGLLGVGVGGSGTILAVLPADLAVPKGTAVTVAITNEPAAGSPGPTTPILLAGSTKTE